MRLVLPATTQVVTAGSGQDFQMNQNNVTRSASSAAASGAFAAVLQFIETEVAKMCAAEVARSAKVLPAQH